MNYKKMLEIRRRIKLRMYLGEIGKTEEDIVKELSNPLIAKSYLSIIQKYGEFHHKKNSDELKSTSSTNLKNTENSNMIGIGIENAKNKIKRINKFPKSKKI